MTREEFADRLNKEPIHETTRVAILMGFDNGYLQGFCDAMEKASRIVAKGEEKVLDALKDNK